MAMLIYDIDVCAKKKIMNHTHTDIHTRAANPIEVGSRKNADIFKSIAYDSDFICKEINDAFAGELVYQCCV